MQVPPFVPELRDGVPAITETGDCAPTAALLPLIEALIDRFQYDRKRNSLLLPAFHQRPVFRGEDEGCSSPVGEVRFDLEKKVIPRPGWRILVLFCHATRRAPVIARRPGPQSITALGDGFADHPWLKKGAFAVTISAYIEPDTPAGVCVPRDAGSLRPPKMEMVKRPPNAEVTVFCPLVSPARHVLPHENVTLGRAAECTIPDQGSLPLA